MPNLKNHDLFISHAWAYNSNYYNLIDLLDEANNFKYRNYSVPEHDPLVDPNTTVGQRKLTTLLDNQVRSVNCILIIAGMYATHRFWIQKEIDLAQKYNKPIIGVIPMGQQRVSVPVQNAAVEMVRWNTSSIVTAIRKHSI